jgi:hypothetical protein
MPEGRGFEFRWAHWISSIYLILPAAAWSWCWLSFHRNEYQEYSWGVKRGQRVRLTASRPSVSRLSGKTWDPRCLRTLGFHGLLLLYFFILLTSHELNISGHMLIWTFFLLLESGIRLCASFSTLCIKMQLHAAVSLTTGKEPPLSIKQDSGYVVEISAKRHILSTVPDWTPLSRQEAYLSIRSPDFPRGTCNSQWTGL